MSPAASSAIALVLLCLGVGPAMASVSTAQVQLRAFRRGTAPDLAATVQADNPSSSGTDFTFYIFAAIAVAIVVVIVVRFLLTRGGGKRQSLSAKLPPPYCQMVSAAGLALPTATAVLICALLSAYLKHPSTIVTFLSKNYSPTSAIITVAVCCEMTTIERYAFKCVLRAGGTITGALEALLAAFALSKLAMEDEHYTHLQGITLAGIVLVNAACQKSFPKHSYAFLVMNITLPIVFYGYAKAGFAAAVGRTLSVFIGMAVALATQLIFPLIWCDATYDLSEKTMFNVTNAMLKKSFLLIDFAFMHNEAFATEDVESFKSKTFRPATRKYFGLDGSESIEDLRAKAKGNAFDKSVEVDMEVAKMQQSAQAAWGDLVFMRWMLHLTPLPHYIDLATKLHPVFVQVSALVHLPRVQAKSWCEVGNDLDGIRENIQKLDHVAKDGEKTVMGPFDVLLDFEVGRPKDERKRAVEEAVAQISDVLERCDGDLRKVKQAAMRTQSAWQGVHLATFIQMLHLVIAGFASTMARWVELLPELQALADEDKSKVAAFQRIADAACQG